MWNDGHGKNKKMILAIIDLWDEESSTIEMTIGQQEMQKMLFRLSLREYLSFLAHYISILCSEANLSYFRNLLIETINVWQLMFDKTYCNARKKLWCLIDIACQLESSRCLITSDRKILLPNLHRRYME